MKKNLTVTKTGNGTARELRRLILGVCCVAAMLFCGAARLFAAGGDLDTTFTASVTAFGTAANTSPARVVVVQLDGRVLVGGFFTVVNGRSYSGLARLNADGTVDQSFNIGTGFPNGGTVNAIAVQPDGKIVAGGTFSFFNGVQRSNLVRLNADGSLDTTFNMGGAGFNTGSTVEAIVLQTNGQILVGGSFVQYNGATVNRLARLNFDGSRDTTFTTNLGTGFNNTTNAIAIETDGQIVVGGSFTSVNGTTANEIVRLNANGTLDTAFITNTGTGFNTNRSVNAVAVQTDGRIVVGGNFTTFNGTARPALVRLNDTGTFDTGFTLAVNPGIIEALQIQTDGRIIAAGQGAFFGVGNLRRHVARVNADGSLDLSFNAGTASNGTTLSSLPLQPDGTIFVVGNFGAFNNVVRSSLVKLNPGGSVDTAFAPVIGASATVNAILVQADNKILIGGDFSGVNESFREKIARLNADGTTDLTFNPGVNTDSFTVVLAIAVQTDGKIIVGGGPNSNSIVRLNSDGSLDTSFTATVPGGGVNAIVIQPDGKILIGGGFIFLNGASGVNRIARLNTDGTTDATFNTGTGFNSTVEDVVLQSNGQIVAVGLFISYNGTSSVNRIARLNANGTLDTTFTTNTGTGFNSNVNSLALQTDGKILVGGSFITFNGTSSPSIVRLNADGTRDTNFNVGTGFGGAPLDFALQPDGRILAVGNFATYNGITRRSLARLNTDGALDASFRSGLPVNILLNAIGLQADGRILIGGNLESYDSIPRFGIARVFAGFAIRGRVTDAANTPLPAIPVISTGPLSRVVLTDNNGDYSFESLPAGNYSVIPNSPAFVFTPTRADFPNLSADQTQNFMAQTIAVPSPTPPLTDNFPPRPNPDPTLWNLGILTQPPGAFDPLVTVSQQTGQLVITPRANQSGLHYNGYVAVNSFDLSGGQISVELVQAGTGGAESLFSIGADFLNFARFLVQSPLPGATLTVQEVFHGQKQAPFEATMPMLMFQLVNNGQVFLNIAIPYDPVAHRFLRFRHVTRDSNNNPINSLAFETSPDASVWTERARGNLGERNVQAITVELAGGTSGAAGSPGPIIFDNLVTQIVNCRFDTAGYTVNESAGLVTVTVRRTGLTNLTSSVEYFTVDGTATQRTRYVVAAGVLSFAAGENLKTFDILLVDNQLADGTQTFDVFLSNPVGSGVTGPGRTIVTITDNDTPPITTNPLETTQFFVTEQYYDFLSRQPDAGGLAFWMNEITGPCNGNPACISQRRWQVSLAFFVELEFQQTGAYVYRLYRAAYGNTQPFPNPMGDNLGQAYCVQTGCPFRAAHIPSYQRFVSDRARVVGSQNLAADQLALANLFASRPEFRQRYPTTQTGPQFVDALLSRINTDSGADLSNQRDALLTLFNSGGRGAVLYRLADDNVQTNPINNRAFIDAEYNRGFVLTQYFGYLRRDPDMPGLNFWRDVVNRFPLRNLTGQNAMVCAFVTSQEYQERFSLISPRTNGECPPAP